MIIYVYLYIHTYIDAYIIYVVDTYIIYIDSTYMLHVWPVSSDPSFTSSPTGSSTNGLALDVTLSAAQ